MPRPKRRLPAGRAFGLVLALLVWGAPARATQQAVALAPTGQPWIRYLIPLPKQVEIAGSVAVPASSVVVRVRAGATDVETNAAARLGARLGWPVQTQPAAPGQFEVLLAVCGRDGVGSRRWARALRRLPNADQAYLIEPEGTNRLVLVGLTGKGVFHAAITLRQLLDASGGAAFRRRLEAESKPLAWCRAGGPPLIPLPDVAELVIPLVRIRDWPDMDWRGGWCIYTLEEMHWMADYKLNLVEKSCEHSLSVGSDGRGHWTEPADRYAGINRVWVESGQRLAINVVPYIPHLPYPFTVSGAFTHFPELRIKTWSVASNALVQEVNAACFSQPGARRILADWMGALADIPGVTAICVWLTEGQDHGMCACADCRPHGQFVMETRAIVEGWRLAQARHPRLGLELLLTQGSVPFNDRILAEVPRGARVTYYNGGAACGSGYSPSTYTVSPDPMIYPLLEKFAARGGRLGVMPTLEPNYDVSVPWTCPHYVHTRMAEFAEKKVGHIDAFPHRWIQHRFTYTAMAEWAWNARGRGPREFAAAWATRAGMPDPEAFADWVELLGPVEWDVYGYGSFSQSMFDEAVRLSSARRAPELGVGLFRRFASEQALALAEAEGRLLENAVRWAAPDAQRSARRPAYQRKKR